MSKRKATLASYEEAVRDILNFAEGDDGDIETIASPLVHDNVEFEQGEYEQSSDEEKGDSVRQRLKELLTRYRLFHITDSVLDLQIYNPIHCINRNGLWETMTVDLGPKNRRDTETTTLTTEVPSDSASA